MVSVCCTLNENELTTRRQLVRETLLSHLLSVTDIENGVELTFSSEAEKHIEKFIELERDCCSFLTFTVTSSQESVRLEVSGSAEAESTLDMFRQGFRAGL